MNKIFPAILWLLVLACGGAAAYLTLNAPDRVATGTTGVAYIDAPWKHLPSISPFQLIDQTGAEFDSAKVAPRPMAVSFFFASCPTICRDLNRQVERLHEELKNEDILFVSISVDPENDTPEVLAKYASEFGAKPNEWVFLTGEPYKIKQIGQQDFRVVVDKETHTDNILLVDRWGRYRDRFKWDDPYDMKRFVQVAKDVLAEPAPPIDAIFRTRNVMAGVEPADLSSVPWIREFHLTNQDGAPFYSRDLTGQVWICSFFFTSCPGICIEQNAYLAGLQSRLKDHPASLVSITTDPTTDTPEKMKSYGRKIGADFDHWTFCTGPDLLIRRISAEFFRAHASGGHHSSQLYVVDRWGNVRGDFDWREPQGEIEMLQLIDRLNAEQQPPSEFEWVSYRKAPEKNQSNSGGH